MSLLIFSLLGWVSSPALQRFLGGPLPSGKMLAQVLGMHSADGLQCHPLQGLFHWQRAIHPRSHPVLEWSTSNDRFIWGYESLVMSVQYVAILASHFSLRAASGVRWGHCWAALQLDFSIRSFMCPSPPFLRCSTQGHKQSACQTLVQSAFWGTQSVMCGFRSSHEPFQFVYGPRHFGRASGVYEYLVESFIWS